MTLDSHTDAVKPGDARAAAPGDGRPLTRAEWRRLQQAAAEAPEPAVETEPLRRRRTRPAVPDVPARTDAATPEFLDVTVTLPAATSVHLAAAESTLEDEFEQAARLFAFTGQTPIQVARAAADAAESGPAVVLPAAAPRKGRAIVSRLVAASFSATVMGVVGLMAVGTTTSATAVGTFGQNVADIALAPAGEHEHDHGEEIQAYVAASDLKSTELVRGDEYSVASMADLAAASGITQFAGTWVNDPLGAVQWPFPVGVPISAHYGSSSYLAKFSTAHHGVDFTPGAGAEIHAIAGGTVRVATESGAEYGVTVVIDHIIDGELVSSRYGHMQRGSLTVKAGDTVTVGEVIGKVGNTGKSTGAHLHLEILIDGTDRIDPVPWLKEHAGT